MESDIPEYYTAHSNSISAWCKVLKITTETARGSAIPHLPTSPVTFSELGLSLPLLYEDVERAKWSFSKLESFHRTICGRESSNHDAKTLACKSMPTLMASAAPAQDPTHSAALSDSGMVPCLSSEELQQRVMRAIARICVEHQIDYSQGMLHISILLAYLLPCPLHGEALFTQLLNRFLVITCPQYFIYRKSQFSTTAGNDSCQFQKHLCLLFHQLFQFHFPSIASSLDQLYFTSYWSLDWFDSLCSSRFQIPSSWLNYWYFILQLTSSKWSNVILVDQRISSFGIPHDRSYVDPTLSSKSFCPVGPESSFSSFPLLNPKPDVLEIEHHSHMFIYNDNDDAFADSSPVQLVEEECNATSDLGCSIYPEYMIVLLSTIQRMREQQREHCKWSHGTPMEVSQGSIDARIATHLRKTIEFPDEPTVWDNILIVEGEEDIAPITRYFMQESSSNSSLSEVALVGMLDAHSSSRGQFHHGSSLSQIRNSQNAEQEEQYVRANQNNGSPSALWTLHLRELYVDFHRTTPKAWFELVDQVMSTWNTLGKFDKSPPDNSIIDLRYRYALELTGDQLVNLVDEIATQTEGKPKSLYVDRNQCQTTKDAESTTTQSLPTFSPVEILATTTSVTEKEFDEQPCLQNSVDEIPVNVGDKNETISSGAENSPSTDENAKIDNDFYFSEEQGKEKRMDTNSLQTMISNFLLDKIILVLPVLSNFSSKTSIDIFVERQLLNQNLKRRLFSGKECLNVTLLCVTLGSLDIQLQRFPTLSHLSVVVVEQHQFVPILNSLIDGTKSTTIIILTAEVNSHRDSSNDVTVVDVVDGVIQTPYSHYSSTYDTQSFLTASLTYECIRNGIPREGH